MKEIAFGGLDFNIVDSYKIMQARIDSKEQICLFGEFSAKAITYKIMGRAEIAFEIDKQDDSTLARIDDILLQEYGKPDYIAKHALKVWKEKDCYIIHGMVDKHYNVGAHILKVCFRKPYCFMCKYAIYDKYVAVLSEISEKWNLVWSHDLVIVGKQMMAWLETQNYSYYLSFTRKKFTFYSIEKREETEGTRMSPSWNTKGKYKTIQDLHNQLESFFNYLEEYDLSLKRD